MLLGETCLKGKSLIETTMKQSTGENIQLLA